MLSGSPTDGVTMILPALPRWPGLLLAALLLAAAGAPAASGAGPEIEAYLRARTAYEAEASAYWQQVSDKRRTRSAKRRDNTPVGLDDYVLTQPPVYSGPPRPPGAISPQRE